MRSKNGTNHKARRDSEGADKTTRSKELKFDSPHDEGLEESVRQGQKCWLKIIIFWFIQRTLDSLQIHRLLLSKCSVL